MADGRADKVQATDLGVMKRRGERIVMVTAYDAPSARLADEAGVDAVLVGDSAAMTVLGLDTTIPITIDEMLILTRAAARGAKRPLVVADLPFGTYQSADDVAVESAIRFAKEGRADAVKLEGAGPMLRRAGAIVDAGVPVMGHIGLTPQSVKKLGGYKPQGRTAITAQRLLDSAMALERAGCFAVVLEAIPAPVAARITSSLTVPTIGIGAGASCDGQVLVWHDLLGLGGAGSHVPRFVKRYAEIGGEIVQALRAYAADVRAGTFPDERHTYTMPEHELERFESQTAGSERDLKK